jgi:hypothetical protein
MSSRNSKGGTIVPRRVAALSPFALLLSVFAGCASQQHMSVRVMAPAVVDLGGYSLVALDRLEGDGSSEVTAELADALRAARNPLTSRAEFEVLDRRDLDRMLDDVRRQRGNDVGGQQLEMLERWKKAEVMIRGQIATHGVESTVTAQDWVDPKTGAAHRTFTRAARACVDVTLEIVTGAGEHVVDRQTFTGAAGTQTRSVDCQPAQIDATPLLADARAQVLRQFMDRVLPHEETVGVVLQTDGDLPELQAGNGFARTGDWPEAERSYRAAGDHASGDLAEVRWKAQHNLGVALTFQGRYDDARTALREAYAMGQDEGSLQMLQLSSRRQEDAQRLRQQDRAATPNR